MEFNDALKEVGRRTKETDSSRGAVLFKNATFHFYEEDNTFKVDVLLGEFNDKMDTHSDEFLKIFPEVTDGWEIGGEEADVYSDKLIIYGLDDKGDEFFKPYTYKDMSDVELDL